MIVDPEDCSALTRALQGLVERPGRTRELGAAARRRVLEQFGHGPIAERVVRLWREALAPTG
jgi:glycosyltransferase involved in cell wall biosynthesis